MNTSVEKILHEVKKVIAGKDDVLEKIMMTVLSRGHVLLDDVPGTGKTTTALAFSRALGLRYGRIQFTPDVLPSDIVGFSMYHKESGSFAYQPGAVMTNLLLADEINRTSSKTQSALLEVMEERQVTVDGQTHKLPDPFVVIATQNPVGSAGTQLLPQAQLDRFMVRLAMGYPDFASQVNILRDRQTGDPLEAVATVSTGLDLLTMQAQTQQVHMADAMLEYVTSLAEASRSQSVSEDGRKLTVQSSLELKQGKLTLTTTRKYDLTGRDADGGTAVSGSIVDTVKQQDSKEKTRSTTSTELVPELKWAGGVLSGTVNVARLNGKTPAGEYVLHFGDTSFDPVQALAAASSSDDSAPTVQITIDGSSVQQNTDTLQAMQSGSYQVGETPVGVTEYTAPSTLTTVDLDTADAAALAALQGELFQRAAGKLLPALAALPDGDSALLSDSMSDEDYQAFLNLLGL